MEPTLIPNKDNNSKSGLVKFTVVVDVSSMYGFGQAWVVALFRKMVVLF